MSNGAVERFNGTLKEMLRKVTFDKPSDWDNYLPAVLFAYREVPHTTTGYSPFELMYGRKVRGPMSIVKTILTEETQDSMVRSTYDYLLDLKKKLQTACQFATKMSEEGKRKSKQYYDRNATIKKIEVGDHVLVLIPQQLNKLELRWGGPFEVVNKISNLNYEIRIKDKIKTFHVNRIMLYHPRNNTVHKKTHYRVNTISGVITEYDEAEKGDKNDLEPGIPLKIVKTPDINDKTDLTTVKICENLTRDQRTKIEQLVRKHKRAISNIPGKTDLVVHDIVLTSKKPIRVKPYGIPYARREIMKKELEEMETLGIVEKSNSDFSSPVVLVKKRDGTTRFCVDFRKLNAVTVYDAEPIPDQEELFSKLNRANYFSKLDLTKGYWQIGLRENCKKYTAFSTPWGLYHFNYLPFGLSTAPATFARLMRYVLQGLDNVVSFFDDICVFSETFEEHLNSLDKVFNRLSEAGLTVKPAKLEIGFETISFLGHMVGKGIITPEKSKIEKILKISAPKTKKHVRALIGLISYYAKFIPNFSNIKAVLTDLLKKEKPNKVKWTGECQRALELLQKHLNSQPFLILPDVNSKFVLRTDASSRGVGGVLLQYREGVLRPVKYVSRKLLPRESRFSTIERECLAIIWTIGKLALYLSNTHFTLQTDQRALQYLNSCNYKNSRLTRWAILLQEFKFNVQHIPGADNIIADYLSRN